MSRSIRTAPNSLRRPPRAARVGGPSSALARHWKETTRIGCIGSSTPGADARARRRHGRRPLSGDVPGAQRDTQARTRPAGRHPGDPHRDAVAREEGDPGRAEPGGEHHPPAGRRRRCRWRADQHPGQQRHHRVRARHHTRPARVTGPDGVAELPPGNAGRPYLPAPAPPGPASAPASPSASATASPSPSASKSGNGDRVPSGLLAATPSPSPSSTATPSTNPVTPTPSATSTTGNVDLKALPGSQGKTIESVTPAFNALDCANTPNPTQGLDDTGNYILSCDPDQQLKYILAPAEVKGSQISSASATVDPQSNEWKVLLTFTHKGGSDWLKLTQKAAKQPTVQAGCGPPDGCNAVAIVLDGVTQSAPTIPDPNGIAGGSAEITGNFTQKRANTLANVLKFGALPLKLEKADVSSVSATLGSDQLRGGLIAGPIGLIFVILYSLLYSRALGLLTVASLALSGLILYAVTTLLGHSSLGYTLSLAGIAGFIVAVGITADSFVVFFERIRDEVREGKSLRSAVERGWPRARRTIISADAVSLLAAVVLYAVSIGDVRGFAFTLGLSTLSDLFIVFFFTKPLLTLLARTKTFTSGAGWTGVGRSRSGPALEPREA